MTSGTCNTFHASANSQNRITDPINGVYQYDAAGNMTHDASHSYTYDAENHLIQVDGGATASYLYDAEGRRVQKTSGGATTCYIYDLAGNVISELNASTWLNVYVRLGSKFFAQYTLGSPRTQFIHSDHLGSTRLVTSFVPGTPPTYSVYDSMDYLPFGEQIAGATSSTHKFTGKERDSESGLDNLGARFDSSTLGRFMSPDPCPLDTDNPQSLNRYVYALDNPMRYVDRKGKSPEEFIKSLFQIGTTLEFEWGKPLPYVTKRDLNIIAARAFAKSAMEGGEVLFGVSLAGAGLSSKSPLGLIPVAIGGYLINDSIHSLKSTASGGLAEYAEALRIFRLEQEIERILSELTPITVRDFTIQELSDAETAANSLITQGYLPPYLTSRVRYIFFLLQQELLRRNEEAKKKREEEIRKMVTAEQ